MARVSKTASRKRGYATETPAVRVTTGAAASFFGRSGKRARRLDRGARLPAEITLIFEDPSDLMRVLSAERLRVLRTVRSKPAPVSKLATDLKRDRQAVRRDVNLLESLGLLKTRETTNPGHGRKRMVESLASQYRLVATI